MTPSAEMAKIGFISELLYRSFGDPDPCPNTVSSFWSPADPRWAKTPNAMTTRLPSPPKATSPSSSAASGNLGPIWIRALADTGATVVSIDLTDAPVEGACVVEAVDVRDRATPDAIAAQVIAEHVVPHVLVNNAGIAQPPAAGAAPVAAVEDVALPDLRVGQAGGLTALQGDRPPRERLEDGLDAVEDPARPPWQRTSLS